MKFFIGIAPPDEVGQQIAAFRASWGPFGTEPHITVKAPNGLDAPQEWLPRVTTLCTSTAPFGILLQGVGQFGTSVLYLRVFSEEIAALHSALICIVNSPRAEQTAFFEADAYQPHLTLLHASTHDLPARSLSELASTAAEIWEQPTAFVARALRIYRSVGDGQGYAPYLDVPLLGQPSTPATPAP